MKKLSLFGFFFFAVLVVSAQTKITQSNLVGKWNIAEVDVKGSYYYSIEKDSASLSEVMKAKAKTPQEVGVMNAALKAQTAGFSKGYFQFNGDGTVEILMLSGDKTSTTYTVNEASSTITINSKGPIKEPISASFVNGKLHFRMMLQNSNASMLLKKDKM